MRPTQFPKLVHTIKSRVDHRIIKAQIFINPWNCRWPFMAQMWLGDKLAGELESDSYTMLVETMVEMVDEATDDAGFCITGYVPGSPPPRFTCNVGR